MKRIVFVLLTFHALVCIGGLPFDGHSSIKGLDSHIRLLTTACDVGVAMILQPDSGVNLSSAAMVAVRINNFGTQSQSHFPVSYRVGNAPVVTEQVSITIPPGGHIVYTFATTVDLSAVGTTYYLTAWTSLGCDTLPQNDTAWKQVANLPAVYCASTALQPGGAEITHVEISGFMHGSGPAGAIYSDHTGLIPPVNLVQGAGYTLRIASSSAPGSGAPSPSYLKAWIDFNRDGVFDTINEQVMGIYLPTDTVVEISFTVPAQAYVGDTRMRIVVQQTQQAGEVVPCGSYLYGETEDYGVLLHAAVGCDAGIAEIIHPEHIVEPGMAIPLVIGVSNFGTLTLPTGGLSLGYTLNGGAAQMSQYTGAVLTPGTTQQVTLPAVTFSQGANRLCVFTTLNCDLSNTFNDTLCIDVFGAVHAALPFADDFESGSYWYRTPGQKNWQLGTPAKPVINAPFSGSNAWITNLDGDYTSYANEHLMTPFFDFSPVPQGDTVVLSFQHYSAMAGGDYGTVGYSTDSGLTWMPLGQITDPAGSNWYNHQTGGANGFSYTNSGWITSSYKLSPSVFNGNANVRFRFTFHSDSAGTSDGWAIDNFKLDVTPVPDDVGVVAFVYPLTDTAAGSLVSGITVAVTNYGTVHQANVPLQLTLNGGVNSSAIMLDTLHPGDTLLVTFPDTITVPPESYTLAAKTLLPSDPYAGNDSVWISFQPLPAYTDVKVSIVEPGDGMPEPVYIFFHYPNYPSMCVYPLMIKLENRGQLSQTSIPINYRFHNSGMLYQYQWNGVLPGDNSVYVTLPEYFKPYPGLQKVTVFMDLPGNLQPANDTASREFIGVAGCIGSIDASDAGPVSNLRNIPNPATDQSDIVFSLLHGGKVILSLSNLTGQVLQNHSFMASEGENRVTVDLSGLANGMYIYMVEFEGRRVSGKMVIQR